jgi:hypothetical protein
VVGVGLVDWAGSDHRQKEIIMSDQDALHGTSASTASA